MIYFNDNDPFVAQWCRNSFGCEVDERDIREIDAPAITLRQHYFAGLGGWEWALRSAGWPEGREVWTGSCPCQPISAAGHRKGAADERHLWPAFFRLISLGRPATILGEQIASADGRIWLAGVRADLETLGYAVGAADLCAAGVGAPHVRQRLYWVAFAHSERPGLLRGESAENRDASSGHDVDGSRAHDGLAISELARRASTRRGHEVDAASQSESRCGASDGVGDPNGATSTRYGEYSGSRSAQPEPESHWASSGSTYCQDGKFRRVPTEPGLQPLADDGRFGDPRIDRKLSSRIGVLRAAGNAVCIPLAAEFIRTVMEL